jgi:hypothetical protein
MTTEETPSTPQPTGVTINDIATLLQIVEICAQRGAFRADELSSVGSIYDKVKSFISAALPQAQPTEGTDQ